MQNWTKKITCLILDHKYVTRLVEGKRAVHVGELKYEYKTLTDVELVCTRCGHVEALESITTK